MSFGVKDLTMSRSYKHTPVYKVGGKTKFAKRVVNKKIRRSVKDNLEKLTEQLETDGRQIFCVIDELSLLSTHKKRKSRIEENCVVLKELNEFSQKYGVEFVCNVVVSKWSQDYKTAINE